MSDRVFPISFAIEVRDNWPGNDETVLVAYVGREKIDVATAKMSGYGAENDPAGCILAMLESMGGG